MESDLTDLRSIIRGLPDLGLHEVSANSRQTVTDDSCGQGNSATEISAERSRTPIVEAPNTRQLDRMSSAAEAISAGSAIDCGALGFMAKSLVQTTLPHSAHPGPRYVRTDGNLTLSITDVGGAGLPYGSYPRLILIWMTTEAVRTASRELKLGSSLSSFMAQLGLQATGGHWGTIPRFRDQMQRLLGAAISTRLYSESGGQVHSAGNNLLLADRFDLWWTPQKLPPMIPPKSSVTLSTQFFEQIVESPVPLDLRAIRALKRSPLALDLYAWATRRVSYLSRPTLIPWESLRLSFGAGYANTPQGRSRFRGKAIEAFQRVVIVYPKLKIENQERGALLRPSCTHVPRIPR